MLYTKVNTAKAEAWKSNSTLTSANPMLVAAESLWCSPNAVLYRREHAFLHENINLVELITFLPWTVMEVSKFQLLQLFCLLYSSAQQ